MKVKVLKPLDSWSMIIDSFEAAKLTVAYAEIDRLRRFENTVLNRTHTRRYTLAGVEGMENQIESLMSVCAEHNNTIFDLQQENKWLRGHYKEAMQLLEAAVDAIGNMALSIREQESAEIEPCSLCLFCPENTEAIGECPGYETNDCFRWVHADRYEALKAQLNAPTKNMSEVE